MKNYLLAEWDYSKNSSVDPLTIADYSNKKFYWICPEGHSYLMSVSKKASGRNCPVCSNRIVINGINDFATTRPELLKEWDYEKNNSLGLFPDKLAAGSGKKAWWICDKGHSYQTSLYLRSAKQLGCPYCSHQKLLKGFNDLETLNPELLKEWDYEKNMILPSEIMSHTIKKVWWKCRSGHSYQMTTASKTRGRGCPICAMATHTSFPEQAIFFYIEKVFPDAINAYRNYKQELDIFVPSIRTAIEYDGYKAHKTKVNKDLQKSELCKEKGIRLIRLREDNLPTLDDHYSTIILLKQSNIRALETAIRELFMVLCISCDINVTRDEIEIKERYDNFKKDRSLQEVSPEISKEWHPFLNGSITPDNVYAKTGHKYWWQCEKGHAWQATPAKRVSVGQCCPYCSNQKVLKGFNDLATLFPEIAKQWSPNNTLTPDQVVAKSSKEYLWIGDCGHEWKAAISSRRKGCGCPYCANQRVLKGFNDLETLHPELLPLWDHNKNSVSVHEVLGSGDKYYWWKCPQCGNSWHAKVRSLVSGSRCPKCSAKNSRKKTIRSEGYDLETLYPDIAKEWDYESNDGLLPSQIKPFSNKRYYWICPVCGNSYAAYPGNRIKGSGCPKCANITVGEKNSKLVGKYDENGSILETFHGVPRAAASMNIKPYSIYAAIKKGTKASGYFWRYILDEDE